MKKGTSKSDGLKVEYVYLEPKTEEERITQESKVSQVYDILFTETLRRVKEKFPGGFWGHF